MFVIVAIIKKLAPKPLSSRALRLWAYGLGLQLFVAFADRAFVAPWYALGNWVIVGLAFLTAFFVVASTAGIYKVNKDDQGQPLESLYPDTDRTAQDETLAKLDAVQASTTAPIGGSLD